MRIQGDAPIQSVSSDSAAGSKLIRSAHEFEAQMMKELLKPICRSEEEGENSESAGALAGFAAEALGESISRAGGFGIAQRIVLVVSRDETLCAAEPVVGNGSPIEVRKLK